MASNFYIDNINDSDKLNEITLLLNGMEEVSRIKVGKTGISFYCEEPENVQQLLKNAGEDLVLKEEVNSRKREFVPTEKKVEHIFMFTNLESEEDAKQIKEVISRYSAYENVSLDFANKLLKVTTNDKKVLVRLNRLVDKVNPAIDVELWKKPFRSQDLFQEKYLKAMIRIAILVVALSLGIVTREDPNIITRLGWLVTWLVVSEKTLIQAYKDIKVKQFISENITITVACLFGIIYGAYVETIFVAIVYQLGERLLLKLLGYSIDKVDDAINPVTLGRREIGENDYEMVSLEDVDIGDILVVLPGETIPLGGVIESGTSELDVFAINGSEVLEEVKPGVEVQSGSVNVKDTLRIKILYTYERSAMNKILEIAMMAPAGTSKTHRIVELVSKVDSILFVVIGILCAVFIPLLDWENNFRFMYAGIIFLTISGTFAYKQASSFAVLTGVAKAFSENIIIKENSGLDALNSCRTIIYDRFDGVEVSEEEMDLFAKLSKLNRDLIIFNDGPVDLEDDQYRIYNNLSVEEKLEIMDKASIAGPVAYIGDNSKDIALLQKSYVGISRGGIKDKKVIDNSDIMLMNSDLNTVIETFMISRKQKAITLENIFFGLFVELVLMVVAMVNVLPWWLALVVNLLISVLLLFNTHRIFNMK
ncbi:MAG TPA: hypothetical protein H9980_11315 [Candidatus Erysipelatoclostridium merdavium]|uniref:P-type ATPase A domain-containing protein n=1 Tax=Candidatus Erysipelatoclostridium merdavium TaxID=2838566 RepID=A0A9D1XNF3_9FIRM|nr:hypothetical protein [uncultured Thomasclavelia sp.]HIX82539.1 hypothetical protein [Candidatus Erysipelatoclostridium merdavium]